MYLAKSWIEIKVVACVFYQQKYDAVSSHHGDDFYTEAEPEDLDRGFQSRRCLTVQWHAVKGVSAKHGMVSLVSS